MLHKNDHTVSHGPRTRWPISIGSALPLHCILKIIYRITHVKALSPLVAIKGEAGHPLEIIEHKAQVEHTSNTPSTHREKGTQDTEPPSTHFSKLRPGT